jgi:hypothetical protein
VLDRYRSFLEVAVADFVRNEVDKRLKAALSHSKAPDTADEPDEPLPPAAVEDDDEPERDKIETTMDELAGFYAVKAIVREDVELDRIAARDTRTYFGILLDDNNRKPICRLWFNRSRKYLSIFDAEKNEKRVEVNGPDDLFRHAAEIRESLRHALSR